MFPLEGEHIRARESKGGQFHVLFQPCRRHQTWVGIWAAFSAHQLSAGAQGSCESHLSLLKGLHTSSQLTVACWQLAGRGGIRCLQEGKAADHVSHLSCCRHPLHAEFWGLDTLYCFSD